MPHKILYLQSTSEIGGSDLSLLATVRQLDKNKFTPMIAIPAQGPLVEEYEKAGAAVFIIPEMIKLTSRKGWGYPFYYLWNFPKAVSRLTALIRKKKIALVHTNTIHNFYGLAAARRCKIPHVWHIREIVLQSKWVLKFERWLGGHFSDSLVAISQAVADAFSVKPLKNLRVIPNGVDTSFFSPNRNPGKIFMEFGIPGNTPVIGLVGRIDHWKGIDTFIEAAALVRPQFPDARFVIIGGEIAGRENYAKQMEALSMKLGLQKTVHFTGWRYQPAEMPQVYNALDVLVLASTWPEPFGRVVIEAMACAKPVIATNHGGPKEICVDRKTGLLIEPNHPAKMAEAISALLENPGESDEMGKAGRNRVLQYYSIQKSVEGLEALYRELLALWEKT